MKKISCSQKENNAKAKALELMQLLVDALKEYADRDNWGCYDQSGCPKGEGIYTDACFVGPEVAEEAINAFEKAQGN